MKKDVFILVIILFGIGLISSGFASMGKEIVRIDCYDSSEDVYNFKISEFEDYYAEGILVHNKLPENFFYWYEHYKTVEKYKNLILNELPDEFIPKGVTREQMVKDLEEFAKAAKDKGISLESWGFPGAAGEREIMEAAWVLYGKSIAFMDLIQDKIPHIFFQYPENRAFLWFLSRYDPPENHGKWVMMSEPERVLEDESEEIQKQLSDQIDFIRDYKIER